MQQRSNREGKGKNSRANDEDGDDVTKEGGLA
jgi:hypothetical protein